MSQRYEMTLQLDCPAGLLALFSFNSALPTKLIAHIQDRGKHKEASKLAVTPKFERMLFNQSILSLRAWNPRLCGSAQT